MRRMLLGVGFVAVFAAGAGAGWLVFPPDDDEAAAGASDGVETTTSTTTSTTTTTTTTLPPPREASLAFTGDLLPHGPVVNRADANAVDGWDFTPMFEEVRPIIEGADLAICHMETPLSIDDTGISGYPVFNAPRALAEAVQAVGYDGCSLASNHAYDQGPTGVEETTQVMDQFGLTHAGMATSAADDLAPVLYDVNDITIAHISATYSLNGFSMPADQQYLVDLIEPEQIVAEAASARAAGAEFVVVSLHWGNEYRSEPTDQQLTWLGQILPTPEVDLVIGHHAHVVQPVDKVGDEWVVFGLGNFLSNQSANCCTAATQDGMIATVDLVETSPGVIEAVGVAYVPTWVDRGNGYVIRVAGDRSGSDLPQATIDALAVSYGRTLGVVSSRLSTTDGLTVEGLD